jgi:hypothetical protein
MSALDLPPGLGLVGTPLGTFTAPRRARRVAWISEAGTRPDNGQPVKQRTGSIGEEPAAQVVCEELRRHDERVGED